MGIRILVVDDNKDAADSLAELFTLMGYDTQARYDGPSGLCAAVEQRPAVCVLDIDMPGMDGYALAEYLRAEFGESVKLVAVSGRPFGNRGTDNPFDEQLTKPADVTSLLGAVATPNER
jgi:CheY-like chemotaxis protein